MTAMQFSFVAAIVTTTRYFEGSPKLDHTWGIFTLNVPRDRTRQHLDVDPTFRKHMRAPAFLVLIAVCGLDVCRVSIAQESNPVVADASSNSKPHPLYRPDRTWPTSVDYADQTYPVTQGAARGYVPDAVCTPCHSAIAGSYAHVGMAKAFYRPRPDNIIEDFDNNHFYHQASDRHYEMNRRGGEFFQRQYQVDVTGKRFGEIEQRVDWIIGSGAHVRTYLHAAPGGELFQLPLAWYSQTKRWGMNPGYDNPNHYGLTRRIERDCYFCHNAYPDVPAGSDALEEPPLFPKELPEGIGCQRCHGPGAEHVRVAGAPVASIKEVRESIVNPATLSPRQREEVCFQCHLQPNLSPTSLVRVFDRGEFSYRAGEPLNDYLFYVDYDEPPGNTERFEINHHPYRLFQSSCYKKSAGRMSCLTCHDPHVKVLPGERAAHYRAKCLSCHGDNDCPHCRISVPGDDLPKDCVACHMPQRRPQDVVQVLVTDHRIVRTAPLADHVAPLKEEVREVLYPPKPYFPDRAPPERTLGLYLDVFAVLRGEKSRLNDFQERLRELHPDQGDPFLYLASGLLEFGRQRDAISTYDDALRRNMDRSAALRGRGYAKAGDRQFTAAVEDLRRSVALNPQSAHHHYLLGSVLVASGHAEDGINELEQAIRLRPNHVSALNDLGETLASLGRISEGARWLDRAVSVQPGSLVILGRLAEMLIYLDRAAESIPMIESALRTHGDEPGIRLALACALVLNGTFQRALELVSDPRVLQVDEPTGRLVMAIARHGLGDATRANSEFVKARDGMSAPGSKTVLRQIMLEKGRSALSKSVSPPSP